MKIRRIIMASAIALTFGAGAANAAVTLSGTIATDNAFLAFISTSPNVLGTLVDFGNNWPVGNAFSTALAPGQTYYLNIEAVNGSEGGIYPSGEWGGLLGSFSLAGSGFKFANGAQTLDTGTANWTALYNNADGNWGSAASNGAADQSPWVTPTGGVFTEGDNSGTEYPWGTYGGQVGGINPGAEWIWASDVNADPGGPTGLPYNGVCTQCTVDFSTEISAVPEPATWAMLLLGFFGIGFIMRGSRRNDAVAAA